MRHGKLLRFAFGYPVPASSKPGVGDGSLEENLPFTKIVSRNPDPTRGKGSSFGIIISDIKYNNFKHPPRRVNRFLDSCGCTLGDWH